MNIREELNKLDQDTFNQYDLFNLYSSVSVDKELKEQVVGLIKESKCEELCKLLSEAYEKQTGVTLTEEAYDNLPEIEDKVKGVTDQVTAKAVKDHEEKMKNIRKGLKDADAEIKDEPFTSGENQPKPEEPVVPDLIEESVTDREIDAVQYAYGFNKKQARDYLKKVDANTKKELVKGFESNAKKSALNDSLKEAWVNGKWKEDRISLEQLTDAQIEKLPEDFLCVAAIPGTGSYIPTFQIVNKSKFIKNPNECFLIDLYWGYERPYRVYLATNDMLNKYEKDEKSAIEKQVSNYRRFIIPNIDMFYNESLKESWTVDTGHYDLWDEKPYTKKQLLYDLNSDKMLEKSKGSFQVGHPDERDLCAEILSDAGYEYEISGDGPWFHFEYWKEENEALRESVDQDTIAKLQNYTTKARVLDEKRVALLKELFAFSARDLYKLPDEAETEEEYDKIESVVVDFIDARKDLNSSLTNLGKHIAYESLKEELNQEDFDIESIYRKIANLKDYLKEADNIIAKYHSEKDHISDDIKLTAEEKQEKIKKLEAEYRKHLEGFLYRLNYQKDKLIESLDENEFSDFNSEFYNKVADLLFKYHLKGKDIERDDVEKAYAWFDSHFYDSDDNPGIEESLDEASTSVIPAPFNKYYKIDKEGELEAPEIVGSEVEDYDCKILHLLIAKKPFEDLLDAPYAVLTDLPDYPVCELVGGSLIPVFVNN